jgi:hypothetical protein
MFPRLVLDSPLIDSKRHEAKENKKQENICTHRTNSSGRGTQKSKTESRVARIKKRLKEEMK